MYEGATLISFATERHGDHERALSVPGHADQRDATGLSPMPQHAGITACNRRVCGYW